MEIPGDERGSRCTEVPSRGAGQGDPQGLRREAGLAEMLPGDSHSPRDWCKRGWGVLLPLLPLFLSLLSPERC